MPRYKDVYELANEVGWMYALVVAAAKRAKQLREGRQKVVASESGNPLTIAIQELLEGKVQVRPPGETDQESEGEPQLVEVVAVDGSGVVVSEVPPVEDEAGDEAEPADQPDEGDA